MKRPIRLIIFDLDGTLVDAYKPVAASLNYSLRLYGYRAQSAQTIRRSVGWGDSNLISRFIQPADLKRVLAAYRRHHEVALKHGTKLLPGAKSILTYLKKKKIILAIATNRPSFYTKIILKQLKVADYFQIVLCADQVRRAKPAPDLLNAIVKKSKAPRVESLYVGDMTIDVECGQRAKIRTVAVVTGSSQFKEIKKFKPYKIIRHINQLKSLI